MSGPETSAPDPVPTSEAPPSRAAHWAQVAGTGDWSDDFGTPKLRVPPERWGDAHRALRDHLPFFSWLSAIDWSSEVAVGDPVEGEEIAERYEVLTRLADVSAGEAVLVSTDLPHEDPRLESLAGVYGGADWHERETTDMFGITFTGHPNPVNIYLPDGFEGHPLRKSYPLLSREVKPWPGAVEVKPLPPADGEGEAGSPPPGEEGGG